MFDFTVGNGPYHSREGVEKWNHQETEIRIGMNELSSTLIGSFIHILVQILVQMEFNMVLQDVPGGDV